MTDKFNSLLSLLKAPSESFVTQVLECFFSAKLDATKPSFYSEIISQLQLDESQFQDLYSTVNSLITEAIYLSFDTAENIQKNLFPQDFHAKLKLLLSKIIAENLPSWKNRAFSKRITLPKLVDFDWSLNIISSSQKSSHSSIPTILLELKIQDPPTKTDLMPNVRTIHVELTRESLGAVLDGLGKINEQLTSVKK
ncbi:comm domain-containing protein [Anaeramoeba ignava]|uniref:Comm domain-containing protein n=1 Tax=Anaeramoeba ignava TaxID=1746090 RepID=A0A9Q0LHK0_ANAIG|nr:comm domain-containing protein [Anaeramoeba ignava]